MPAGSGRRVFPFLEANTALPCGGGVEDLPVLRLVVLYPDPNHHMELIQRQKERET
jgi:hypothetical protein